LSLRAESEFDNPLKPTIGFKQGSFMIKSEMTLGVFIGSESDRSEFGRMPPIVGYMSRAIRQPTKTIKRSFGGFTITWRIENCGA